MRRWRGWYVVVSIGLGAGPPIVVQGTPVRSEGIPYNRTSVLDHGIVPGGSVDNSAALDAAAQYAAANDMVLYFPPGVYGYAAGDFDMCPGLHVRGAGCNVSILRSVDGSAPPLMLNFYGDDSVVIEDMGFDGNFSHRNLDAGSGGFDAKLINISRSHQVRIERCLFRDMTHGVVIVSSGNVVSSDVTIRDCTFVMQSRLFARPDGTHVPAFGVLVSTNGGAAVTVSGCTFTGGADDPTGLSPGSCAISMGGDGFEITGNTFTDYHHGNGGIAIHLAESSSNGIVRDNVMTRCGGDNLSIRGTDHLVTGNRIYQSDDQGIACENAQRCTFTANRVDSTRTAAIRVLNSVSCAFHDNFTKDPGSPIGGPRVGAMACSHYHIRNNRDTDLQAISDIRIDGATMTTTNGSTAYGIYVGTFGTHDHVSDVLLGAGNVFVTSQPSDTLWGGNEFPRALRPGSMATGRLRDAPGGRPTTAADPDTLFQWTGREWVPETPLDGPVPAAADGPQLGTNYPNPFSPRTFVDYYLRGEGPVHLTVHDVGGRLVETLVDGVQPPGRHTVTWDGRDAMGGRVRAGAYFLRLSADRRTAARKIVMVD